MNMTLRVLTALALFIDAGVHIYLAPGYQAANPGGIGQGNLFLLESAAAVVVVAAAMASRAVVPRTPSGSSTCSCSRGTSASRPRRSSRTSVTG